MAAASNEDRHRDRTERRPRVALITYDVPHKKTQDVLFPLIWRDCFNLTLVITPFKSRPSRDVLFQHRPVQLTGPAPSSLASRFGLNALSIEDWQSFRGDFDFFLVCGSGLIDPEFCQTARIVNCHPGLIPKSRGLDAFKWAIHDDLPIGNTLHFIDHQVDLGEVFHHQITEIFPEDSLASFAGRHYMAEIHLLSHFDSYLQDGTILDFVMGDPRKRMPRETEALLVHSFDVYKEKHTRDLKNCKAGHSTTSGPKAE
jgi:phosphoribosylglycinamide formyltransferase-1